MRKLAVFIAVMILVAVTAAGVSADQHQRNFVAPLSGDEEVPPVDTNARGLAKFQLSKDGTELSYRLIVANIEDVTMAHIHLGAAGENGSVVVWLYPDAPPPQQIEGRFSGVLATGVITEENLVGPLDPEGDDPPDHPFKALIQEIRDGSTYVNVHTDEHPAGEVRGQIR